MKKLLLLSALLIFACSSDDSSDNSNQTFLERYADIVWQSEGSEELIRLSFDLNGFTRNSEDCLVYVWNEENPNNGQTWNLLENNHDNIVINKEESGTIDFTSIITISEDENTLTENISDGEIYNAIRTTLTDPCE